MVRHSAEEILQLFEQHWPEASGTATGVIMRLVRSTDLIREELARQVGDYGLSSPGFLTLRVLRREPGYAMTPTDLALTIGLSPGGMTKVLKQLEDADLTIRTRDSQDGRSVKIQLSDRGRALIEEVQAVVGSREAAMLAEAYTAEEMEMLSGLLKRLLGLLEPELQAENEPTQATALTGS